MEITMTRNGIKKVQDGCCIRTLLVIDNMVKRKLDTEDIKSSVNKITIKKLNIIKTSNSMDYCFNPDHPKPFKNPKFSSHIGSKKKWKNLKNIMSQIESESVPVDQPTFANIESPPSLFPKRKYCDLTGLESKYTCPKTGLRYHSVGIYEHLRHLGPSQVQQLLSLRNAHTILK